MAHAGRSARRDGGAPLVRRGGDRPARGHACRSAGGGHDAGPARNVAKSAGLAQLTESIGATIGDVNRDGRPDVLLNRAFKAPATEYLNTGVRFGAVNRTT